MCELMPALVVDFRDVRFNFPWLSSNHCNRPKVWKRYCHNTSEREDQDIFVVLGYHPTRWCLLGKNVKEKMKQDEPRNEIPFHWPLPFPSVAVTVPDKLQQVMLPLVDRDQCNDWYQSVYESGQGVSNPFGTNRPVTDKMQCAGYEEGGRSVCFVSCRADI